MRESTAQIDGDRSRCHPFLDWYMLFTLCLLFLHQIEHGYLRGNKRLVVSELNTSSSAAEPDIKPSQRRTLMDLIIETICKCSEEFDDTVHLQVQPLFSFLCECCR